MTPEPQPALRASAMRTRFGLLLTGVYLVFIVAMYTFSEQSLHELALNELGDYFAGVFGPVAILWLVLGFLQQGEELRYSAEALHLQAAELKASVEEQRNMVKAARDQTAADADARRATLEESRRLARPILHASVAIENLAEEEWDPEFPSWLITIENHGPPCRSLAAQLQFANENILIPIRLDQHSATGWNGTLEIGANPTPHSISIQCTTSRNELEHQYFVLQPNGDRRWETADIPARVVTRAVTYDDPRQARPAEPPPVTPAP